MKSTFKITLKLTKQEVYITKNLIIGTSLEVQWLRFNLPVQWVWVRSLVGELRSHMPCGQKTETENRNNIVTNSVII